MTSCDYCKNEMETLPYKCRHCGGYFCSDHRLPEYHNCETFKMWKEEHGRKWQKDAKEILSKEGNKYQESKDVGLKFDISNNIKYHKTSNRKKSTSSKNKKSPSKSKTKKNFYQIFLYSILFYFDNFKEWLTHSTHRAYNFKRKKKELGTIIFILILSLIGLFFFYSRADQFNQIDLWVFNLGGLLVLTSLFFMFKYLKKLIKEAKNLIKRQKNWLKVILIILLLFILWQGISNHQSIKENAVDFYHNIEFSLLSPITIYNSPTLSGKEIPIPDFFYENKCSIMEEHALNQDLSTGRFKKNFCGAICGDYNLEYQRYNCDKDDVFHCYCKVLENE